MQIRGEYPAEPPPAYEDTRHHANTRAFDLPPGGGIAGASNATSETPSTERNGLLGELLDRFSEPDRDSQQEPQQPSLPPIGDHKIQTDISPLPSAPETPPSSEPIPQHDRNRSINTGSKPLSGTFPLYDFLSLLTHSGSLTATVIPHPAYPLQPKPAELKVHSHSGVIHLETQIPDPNDEAVQRERGVSFQRTYRTSVTSHSSRIEARVVVGEKTVVQSHSGMVGVEMVVPCVALRGGRREDGEEGDGGGEGGGKEGKKKKKTKPRRSASSSEQLSLHTQTHSSNQEVRIVMAHGTPATLSREGLMARLPQHQQQILTSYHHTHSGKLRLHYPPTWTGRIEGTIGKPTSQISIHGTGVDVIEQTPHRFLAKRRCPLNIGGGGGGREEEGMMANTLRFYSFSGLVEIFFD
ncbi:hypothetical protein KC332_g15037 [Hortaea werneckii]|nr:hypothetical protein KC358_g16578 [Hortaea werneckii]KAI6804990.1 hypothetical protein KC350_g14782 [Hortaea werneckii]KAI6905289.1 hypothetical protein KC348_g15010 [Hortaea werneckii]KAI6920660.1 hypothetical protein KC341_g16457 [Hortaea werneckii]KAI6957565.1 hypothetical protein KC321_g14520 [Hortaea werneckii]